MKISDKKLAYIFLALSLVATQALAKENEGKYTGQYTGAMKAIAHTTLTFASRSSTLTKANQTSLRRMVQDARDHGKFKEVIIAAWSDKSLPRQGQKRTGGDRNLAKARAAAISSFVRTNLEVTAGINVYNMAERTNWLAKLFRTSDAELKSLFSKKGAQAPVTNAEFEMIKNEGGPKEAVVVIENALESSP